MKQTAAFSLLFTTTETTLNNKNSSKINRAIHVVRFFLYFCIVIELARIYGILSSFLGESKQGGYIDNVEQYQFNCPYCADDKGYIDGKYNLEISFEILKFHCWSCGSSGSLSKLIKRWGNREALKEYYEIVKDLKASKLYEFSEKQITEKPETQLSLPKTFKKINLKTCTDKKLKTYLKKRCIDQWTINKFNIGATTWNEEEKSWANRIIIPSYDDFGNLNFFVGRDFLEPQKKKTDIDSVSTPHSTFVRPKYKNCDADKKEIVFQEKLIDWDSDIVLVEGALDCVYGPNTVSMLGKSLTQDNALFSALVERAKAKIIVCLDNDTKEAESLKICRLLDGTKLSGRIYWIQMDEYKDFGDAFEKDGIEGVVKCIRSAKKYDKDKDF